MQQQFTTRDIVLGMTPMEQVVWPKLSPLKLMRVKCIGHSHQVLDVQLERFFLGYGRVSLQECSTAKTEERTNQNKTY